ncbi:hypothetical protein AAAA52_01590, partial [Klebsiella pneumoniae]|uniref:hypothetical protein n=1 Tax=Klebsiella pneumoniae TaxID=573 RepID=UPI0034D62472
RIGGKKSQNPVIRWVCGKNIGPDPRNFKQRATLGRTDLLIRTFLRVRPYSSCMLSADVLTPRERS